MNSPEASYQMTVAAHSDSAAMCIVCRVPFGTMNDFVLVPKGGLIFYDTDLSTIGASLPDVEFP
ncbi:unnamed protein product [Clonostachys solani]|uniref:Uncharacterized protein n=1 Tax=Clonostachys solani TaxID=160281 RepID=A0A9N9Z0Z4_9HYPO|nr:unnamed protein product [Clonostachys solani]